MQTEKFYKTVQLQKETFTAELCLDYFNERLRVDDYRGNINDLAHEVITYAEQNDFTKVIIKAREEHMSAWLTLGYQPESLFHSYFNGGNAIMMCRYYTDERKRSDHWLQEDDIMDQVIALPPKMEQAVLPPNYSMRLASKEDCLKLAKLYDAVFEVYPTPMDDPNYIVSTMDSGTIYYVVEHQGVLVSAASAEINATYHNAEITDCATLVEHRKYGLMKVLVQQLEEELKNRRIFCAYSIARALSFGMNAVFCQRNYRYYGRMVKNCRIFDKFEDMNLWVKDLSQ
ncbi:beta-lysine acetyltransferase [Fictibacillus macauensis ZFHKF-1]|uniref:Beta-lysine acetyltransferase n=1 Tax=Fictibacillus macauensis ZFHKF-1 TaxID=1196324 RepID=I8ALN8_9BACL|nr:putative beta-lysine N-acetyltransferase [Fictibacillus macauensis]EIT86842.1 beta-lysine acetyltransferase [Fictibacillus macauensis ZFHKF-1]